MNSTLLISLIFILLIIGLATLNGVVIALALPFMIMLAAGLLDQSKTVELRATRQVSPDRAMRGEPIQVHLSVVNEGAALAELELIDSLPSGLRCIDGNMRAIALLGTGEKLELHYSLEGDRGLYSFDSVNIQVRNRVGMVTHTQTLDAPAQLFILPELTRLRQTTLRPRRTRVYSGVIPARQGGPGIEFFGVRAYQPGDPTRWINARATARHEEALFVNEFEQERVADIGIILDARELSNVRVKGHNLFEYGVQATAALADMLLTQGNRVGMLIYGSSIHWTFPGYGKIQRERILRVLATARSASQIALESFDTIPTRLFPIRSQLIIISPLLASDLEGLRNIRSRGYPLLVLTPDPVAFEESFLRPGRERDIAARVARLERELTLSRIRQNAIHVVNWPVETPLQQIVTTALSRHPMLGHQ